MTDIALARACARVLELLEQRHGVGVRGAHCPSWIALRLGPALEQIARQDGIGLDDVAPWLEQRPVQLAAIADLLRVGETSFYRDARQWDALRSTLLPGLSSGERLRAASVGCSTGEEAWTLAMLLDEASSPKSGGYRVVGIDRSQAALCTARFGVYPSSGTARVPKDLARRYFELSGEDVRVAEALRGAVTFICRDVMSGLPPGEFDLIMCKNMLIYFGAEAGARAAAGLMRALSERGVLVVSRSEVPRLKAFGFPVRELVSGISVFFR